MYSKQWECLLRIEQKEREKKTEEEWGAGGGGVLLIVFEFDSRFRCN